MRVTTAYYATGMGRGRIKVQWQSGDGRQRQRAVAYDHSVADPHAVAVREVFDSVAVTEVTRGVESFPDRRVWEVPNP